MKRTLIFLVGLTCLLGAGYAAPCMTFGNYTRGVVMLAKTGVEHPAFGRIKADTCFYVLDVPPDIDIPETPTFDTTIVRQPGCSHHWLHLPAQGTSTTYVLRCDTVVREVGFYMHDESEAEWLDITQLPVGRYDVTLLACGNGGSFFLRIE